MPTGIESWPTMMATTHLLLRNVAIENENQFLRKPEVQPSLRPEVQPSLRPVVQLLYISC